MDFGKHCVFQQNRNRFSNYSFSNFLKTKRSACKKAWDEHCGWNSRQLLEYPDCVGMYVVEISGMCLEHRRFGYHFCFESPYELFHLFSRQSGFSARAVQSEIDVLIWKKYLRKSWHHLGSNDNLLKEQRSNCWPVGYLQLKSETDFMQFTWSWKMFSHLPSWNTING